MRKYVNASGIDITAFIKDSENKKLTEASYVIIHGNIFYCEACKQEHHVKLPMPVYEFFRQFKAFIQLHKNYKTK